MRRDRREREGKRGEREREKVRRDRRERERREREKVRRDRRERESVRVCVCVRYTGTPILVNHNCELASRFLLSETGLCIQKRKNILSGWRDY